MEFTHTTCDVCLKEINTDTKGLEAYKIRKIEAIRVWWYFNRKSESNIDLCGNCYDFILTLQQRSIGGEFEEFRKVYDIYRIMCPDDKDKFLDHLLEIAKNQDRYHAYEIASPKDSK